MIYELGEHRVTTAGDDFYVADNATVIGRVFIGHHVSIWHNVIIRADLEDIVVGDDTNIQEGCILHADEGTPLTLHRGCIIGHMAMLHGCEIGEYSLIGINATILNGAKIGHHCLIGANALIEEGVEIPDGSLVVGTPGRVKRKLTAAQQKNLENGADHYIKNANHFQKNLRPDPRFMK